MAEIKRIHYFTGELLEEKDFTQEQGYHMLMRRRHNQLCHGFGVVDGLVVSRTADRQVQISAGSAIDGQGREVVYLDNQSYTLRGGDPTLYLTLQYGEVLDADVDKSRQPGVNDVTRWTERPILAESATVPPDDRSVIVIARITLKAGGVIDVIDSNSVPRAAVSAIAPGSVHEEQIVDGSVTDAKIFSVSGAKLTDNTVTSGKIVALDGAKLTDNTVTSGKIVALDGAKLTDNTVTSGKIVALDGAKLTDNTVTSGKIVALDGAKLTDNTVASGKIVALDGAKLTDHTVTAAKLVAGTIGFAAFAASTPGSTTTTLQPNEAKDFVLDTPTFNSTAPQLLLVTVVPTTANAKLTWVPTVTLTTGKLKYGATVTNTTGGTVDVTVTLRAVPLPV